MMDSVTYVDHVIDKKGVHPTQDKVEAIINASVPTNVSQLRSFINTILCRVFCPIWPQLWSHYISYCKRKLPGNGMKTDREHSTKLKVC